MVKATLVEAQSPTGFAKVPYTTSRPPNLINTGDIHENDYNNMILEIIDKNLLVFVFCMEGQGMLHFFFSPRDFLFLT